LDIKQVCVIGLGIVGFNTAMYCKNRGLTVYGYDISHEAVHKAFEHGIYASSRWKDLPRVDIYLVCVSTGLDNNGSPDMSAVMEVCRRLVPKKPKLVCIESTVAPGTVRKIYREIFDKKIPTVYCPQRYWGADPQKRGVRRLRVIRGTEITGSLLGQYFYRVLLNIPMHIVSSVEVAELCKIFENAQRYTQIAIAEEFKMIADRFGVNFTELRKAINTTGNPELLEARDGIGGHCLPMAAGFTFDLYGDKEILLAARMIDLAYRKQKED
jgi:UDP-N-acetyl-D-mannosaminuronic acid dehydrogenase